MSKARRRITLQLIPLLDLLLVVLFAQFLQLREQAELQSSLMRRAELQAESDQARVASDRRELAQLQEEVGREREQLRSSLSSLLGEQEQIASLAAELLQLPTETVSRALRGKSAEEVERLKRALANLPAPQAADIVHQIATISEMRRSCDVWQIHIDDNDVVRLSLPPAQASFRVDKPSEFERRLFEWYRTLPPSRSLVIIQVTWGDSSFGTRFAVREGLVRCLERLRADRNGRTLFEYVILGYRPSV